MTVWFLLGRKLGLDRGWVSFVQSLAMCPYSNQKTKKTMLVTWYQSLFQLLKPYKLLTVKATLSSTLSRSISVSCCGGCGCGCIVLWCCTRNGTLSNKVTHFSTLETLSRLNMLGFSTLCRQMTRLLTVVTETICFGTSTSNVTHYMTCVNRRLSF
ncbi:hypothetical protein EDC96DRAFT_513570 [Choanephora cucurbitarum]|nr:hypothetical protein EDC96DRAFT_513570 [Choanephora cucurbitarum]